MDIELITEIVLAILAVMGWGFARRSFTLKRVLGELRDLFDSAENPDTPEDQKAVAKSIIKQKLEK